LTLIYIYITFSGAPGGNFTGGAPQNGPAKAGLPDKRSWLKDKTIISGKTYFSVILNEVKDLNSLEGEILRWAQNDNLGDIEFLKWL